MTTNSSILSEAADIVGGSRQADYGTPLANHSRTAALWSAYLGIPVTARQVCMLNILQKVSRDVHAPKRDNLVDIAGYAENAHLCERGPLDPSLAQQMTAMETRRAEVADFILTMKPHPDYKAEFTTPLPTGVDVD